MRGGKQGGERNKGNKGGEASRGQAGAREGRGEREGHGLGNRLGMNPEGRGYRNRSGCCELSLSLSLSLSVYYYYYYYYYYSPGGPRSRRLASASVVTSPPSMRRSTSPASSLEMVKYWSNSYQNAGPMPVKLPVEFPVERPPNRRPNGGQSAGTSACACAEGARNRRGAAPDTPPPATLVE